MTYDNNIHSLATALITVYFLIINNASYALPFICIYNLTDYVYGEMKSDYIFHHFIGLFGFVLYIFIGSIHQNLLYNFVWYLLLHEVSTIPFTLIYILQPYSIYKYLKDPLRLCFASSFIFFRTISIIGAFFNINCCYIICYTIIFGLSFIDMYWGLKIIKKLTHK